MLSSLPRDKSKYFHTMLYGGYIKTRYGMLLLEMHEIYDRTLADLKDALSDRPLLNWTQKKELIDSLR